MDSYIEITWIANGIMISTCSLFGIMLFQQTCKTSKLIAISFLITAYFMLIQDTWLLLIVGEMIYGMVVFQRPNKAMLLSLSLRILILQTLQHMISRSIVGMIWYVPIASSFIALWMILVFGLVLFYLPRIGMYFLKSNYRYPVTVSFPDIVIESNGYLDSGNLATYRNYPIIFLNRSAIPKDLEQQLRANNATAVSIRSLQGQSMIDCYHANLRIPGYQEREVLVGFMDELNIKKGCDVLLNVKVFQVH